MNHIQDLDTPIILKEFLIYMETIKGKSKNTVNEYYYDLRMFFRFFKQQMKLVEKDIEFDQIKIFDIDETMISRITLSDLYSFMSFISRERNNSANARARKVASIKSFFNYACNKAKLIKLNPASELESPKIIKRLPRYLNVEESKQLLTSVDGDFMERDYCMITLFLNCGMRLSELVSINLDNIRDESLTIVGKGGKERTIYLNEACMASLTEYMKVRPVDGVKTKKALFLSSRKQRISANMVHRIVKNFIIKAGLDPKKYSVHKLRHTAATLMYKYGKVDIRALQEILGHESIATTEIYTHLDKQQLRDAVDSNPLSVIRKEK